MHETPKAGADMSRAAEAKLIRRAQRGQPDAYRLLVEAYQERLYAFVWRIVRNHHEAEDLCQAAFVKAYESLSSYSKKYAFSTWLFTIAYRLCLNYLRKKKPVATDLDYNRLGDSSDETSDAVANSEEAHRLKDVIWSSVDQLSEPQKASVLLFYRENKSCQEIGEVLGIPAVTVKSHLHRAREKLGKLLKDEVEDWSALRALSDSHFA
jgi:RNA polymerase sigma-70 factor (ECF subfamily)